MKFIMLISIIAYSPSKAFDEARSSSIVLSSMSFDSRTIWVNDLSGMAGRLPSSVVLISRPLDSGGRILHPVFC